MIRPPAPYQLRAMQVRDIPQVMTIESRAFPRPWPAHAYEDELTNNQLSHCYVLEAVGSGHGNQLHPGAPEGVVQCLGYGCFWLLLDEAHISTLAVAERWRRRGLGELILQVLIEEAIRLRSTLVTLEVRESNQVAQRLYAKYGLAVVGRRKRYYADNNEDAIIMTVEPLDDAYREDLAMLRAQVFKRLS